jgi:FkbM family methyltransferase
LSAKRDIQNWLRKTFGRPGKKLFLELGAHRGEDTTWMAQLPDVTIHAFEPDARNHLPEFPNVIVHRLAVAATDGQCKFVLSDNVSTSSSIHAPTNSHYQRFPTIKFNGWVDVDCMRLDTFIKLSEIDRIDFIWADVQGAEGDMIEGGRETLARTSYLFTEYSNEEWYEGQITLDQILAMLPSYRILYRWKHDVLLVNNQVHV